MSVVTLVNLLTDSRHTVRLEEAPDVRNESLL